MVWDVICEIKEDLIKLGLILLVAFLTITILPDFARGKKTIIEGEFTIISKNEEHFLWITAGKTFTLESDNKERYTVYVSDTIYQSYFVNENIKAAFASYENEETCDELEIKSTFEEENIRKES